MRRLTACGDFHHSLLPAAHQAAASAVHPAVGKEVLAAAVQALITPDATTSMLPAGHEAPLLLAFLQAIAACLEAAGGDAAPTAGSSAAALYAELTAAVKLVGKRLRLLGCDAFAGTAGQVRGLGRSRGVSLPPWQPCSQRASTARTYSRQASCLHAICGLAYNQLLGAVARGAHEQVVALSTTTWQLLPLADAQLQADATGVAQQARVLLLASQALLDLHAQQPDR